MRRWGRLAAAGCVGTLVGALMTMGAQTWRTPPDSTRAGGLTNLVARGLETPATFLAWVPRGLPRGFGKDVSALPETGDVAIVAEDVSWLRRSWSAAGDLVDDPRPGYRIPLDVAAVDPEAFRAFLPQGRREMLRPLESGQGILGATSASLRGLGAGATLDFGSGVRVTIAGVLPDEAVGAAELLVNRKMGALLGVKRERYLLVRGADGRSLSADPFAARLHDLLPASLGVNRSVQVRAPGDTPFFRAGDAVLPPVLVKTFFGEFGARPAPGQPGVLRVDPAWEREHLVSTRLPVLGAVRCHRGIVDQLRGAMEELVAAGLRSTVRRYHGCYVPRYIGWDDDNMISYHSWGIAFDVNLFGNLRGQPPDQDPRLVAVLERWGFQWGGRWIVPDGNHFEYRRAPTT